MPSFSEAQPAPVTTPLADPYRLLRRWFVKYNPLYLASAGLLLAGVLVLSGHLRQIESGAAELWLSATIELYQWVLIGGAALLYRVAGQRRPAVILAIMTVVFLADVTFRTEVAGGLDEAGLVAATVWLVNVGLKLYALARAVRLRLSRSAMALPMAAAVGLAFAPYALHEAWFDRSTFVSLITMGGFGMAVAAAWAPPSVTSEDELDEWGESVLRRATRATWMIWIAMFAFHATWWSIAFELPIATRLLALVLLVAALHARTEARVWLLTAGACATALLFDPDALSSTAALAFGVFILVGKRGLYVTRDTEVIPSQDEGPYRAAARAPETIIETTYDEAASRRCYVGAVLFAYIGASTLGYTGGPLPEHHIGLDVVVTAGLLYLAATWRAFSPVVVAFVIDGHLAATNSAVIAPDGSLQWGMTLITLGFAALIAGIALSWHVKTSATNEES